MSLSDRIVEFMKTVSSYPDQPSRVEMVETHISWVFLTDRFVYKLKKPVQFEFVDFSTPELRHHACLEEMRLNRRLAPDVYIAIVPVTQDTRGSLQLAGAGTELDWVVQMRRLPADKSLDVILRERRLAAEDARSLASYLVACYASLLRKPLVLDDYWQMLDRHIRANFTALLDALPAEAVRIRRVQSAQLCYLNVEADLFEKRASSGHIVDGHGDLRPEHIYLENPPVVIDCIEFSEELRKVDVADELSFLVMECQRLGNSDLGDLLVSTYERVCGDRIPVALLAFYRSYRACVRAKVCAIRGQQQTDNERQPMDQLAQQYIAWAVHFAAEIGRPSLIIVGGLMGTGKSTLAGKVAHAFAAELLSTDRIRRSMLGASPTAAEYGTGIYATDLRNRVYDELFCEADKVLDTGQSVVLDGTFLTRELRDRADELGKRHGAVSVHVLCECPRQLALARIHQRATAGQSDSEARVDLYDRQAHEFKPIEADERAVKVDTSNELSIQLQTVCDRLRASPV